MSRSFTLAELAKAVDGVVRGDAGQRIEGVNAVEAAGANKIAWASDARHAAAIPAGPAPTTATSAVSRSTTGLDLHAGTAELHTGSPMRNPVDRHPALEADTHGTDRPPRLALDRGADPPDARIEQGSGHTGLRLGFDGAAVDDDGDAGQGISSPTSSARTAPGRVLASGR